MLQAVPSLSIGFTACDVMKSWLHISKPNRGLDYEHLLLEVMNFSSLVDIARVGWPTPAIPIAVLTIVP